MTRAQVTTARRKKRRDTRAAKAKSERERIARRLPLGVVIAPRQGHAHLTMARAEGVGLVMGVTTGKYGKVHPVILKVPDEDLVGALEDPREFGGVLAKVGLMTVAALANHPVVEGPESLVRGLIKWAGIDVEALRAELEEVETDVLAGAGVPDSDHAPGAGGPVGDVPDPAEGDEGRLHEGSAI